MRSVLAVLRTVLAGLALTGPAAILAAPLRRLLSQFLVPLLSTEMPRRDAHDLICRIRCRVRSTHPLRSYQRSGGKNLLKAPSKPFKTAELISAALGPWECIGTLNRFLGGRFGGPGDEINVRRRSIPGPAKDFALI
jgi:hypothetical protein